MFNELKKKYDDFRDKLFNSIKNPDKSKFTLYSEDCYLIEESSLNGFLNYFKNNNNSFEKIPLPKNLPVYIKTLENIIDNIQKGKKMRLISKQIIEPLYRNENDLTTIPIIKYYAGNNKLIIEYKNKIDDKALLLINPEDQNSIANRAIIFSIDQNVKFNLFKDLLSEENNSNIISNQKYCEYIMSFSDYTNEINKKNIIRILVNIYNHQKNLKIKKEKIFKENDYVYLINIEWLNKFLEYYDYSKIKQSIIDISKKNPNINFIIESLYKKSLINFGKEKNEDILNVQKIFAKLYTMKKIYNFNKCNIFSSNTIFLINKYILKNKILNNFRKNIYVKNKDLYFVSINCIIIGNLNEKLFIPKYILSYDSKETLQSEKIILDSNEIEDYIKSRNCDINNNNKIQNLVNNNKIIGQLTNLTNSISANNNMPMDANLLDDPKTWISKKIPINVNNKKKNFNNAKSANKNNIKGIHNMGKIFNSTEIGNNSMRIINIQKNDMNLSIKNFSSFNKSPNKKNEINQSILYSKKYKEQQDEINNLKKIIQELKNELKNEQNKLDKEKINKLKVDEILKGKDNRINELEKENFALKNETKNLKQFDSIQQELKDFKKDNTSNRKENQDVIETNKEKANQINNLERDNKELKDKINKLLKEKEELKKNNSEIENLLQEEKKANIDSLNNRDIKNKTINNENKELKSKLQNLIKELNNEGNKYNELFKSLNSKEKEINNLRASYDLKMKELDNLKKENLNLDFIIKQNANESNKLTQQFNFLNQEKNTIENQKRDIENREIDLQQRFNAIIKENNEIENKRREFQNELKRNEEIKKENNTLIFQNQQLINELQQKQNQLNEITNQINQAQLQLQKGSNQDQSKPMPPKPLSPIRTYTKPTLIGLNNIGATCFMNATLQCFSQTKGLTNYFLKQSNCNKIINNNIAISKGNEPQLSPIYLDLIKKLWNKNSNSKAFSPKDFMNTIEKMNPLFKQGQPGDSKDFIIFILEQFHTELKRPIKNKITPQGDNKNVNQYDKQAALNYFIDDFMKETSIISDLFFGIIETTNVCLKCKRDYNSKGMNNPIVYNYQKINCIIFPLEEVKNYKNSFIQNNYNYFKNQNNIVSIYECFFYYQKTDAFTGSNQNYCNMCKQLNDSLYTTKIYASPNILILILNRGKDNIYNVKLDFSETIDISDFVIAKEKPRIIYNLYGVITHIGQSGPSAHFVASCKSPVDGNWYRYNDSFVNPININNVRKDIIDYGTPYILFYQKI